MDLNKKLKNYLDEEENLNEDTKADIMKLRKLSKNKNIEFKEEYWESIHVHITKMNKIMKKLLDDNLDRDVPELIKNTISMYQWIVSLMNNIEDHSEISKLRK